ncbi:hypothetical protein IFM89_000770 [Coptis chinensis]|uniref:Response regulatory domain-containing protein n=1 Tax=Coptis chinensis TaxID=261450 RepID=A0A835ISE8_9MAGN|nr:hypothetical protein IFM89_000770 [Coptis chinensis]
MMTDGVFAGSDTETHELHVLAVDDSLIDRKVIERLLKISCCKVTVADSGRMALQYLGLDGETNVGFNESSAFKEIPVVIMSSEKVLPRINRCLEEGAEEFIVKPVKLSDVKRLKHHIMRDEVEENEEKSSSQGTLKRKLDDTNDDDVVFLSSPPSSPLSTLLSSSSSDSSPSPSPSPSPSSSPSRKIKMSD